MAEQVATKSLAAALLDAQTRIDGVTKASRNDFAKYFYASSDDIVTAARAALAEAGVLFFRKSWRLEEGGPTGWRVAAVFEAIHPASGESLTIEMDLPVVDDKKPKDKIVLGQVTTLLGYALRDLLLIPRHDEQVDARYDDGHDGGRNYNLRNEQARGEARGGKRGNTAPAGGNVADPTEGVRQALAPVAADPAKLRAVYEVIFGEDVVRDVDNETLFSKGPAKVVAGQHSRARVEAAVAQVLGPTSGGTGWKRNAA